MLNFNKQINESNERGLFSRLTIRSHREIQSSWKWCEQGRRLASSFSLKSSMQIAHCRLSPENPSNSMRIINSKENLRAWAAVTLTVGIELIRFSVAGAGPPFSPIWFKNYLKMNLFDLISMRSTWVRNASRLIGSSAAVAPPLCIILQRKTELHIWSQSNETKLQRKMSSNTAGQSRRQLRENSLKKIS